MKNSCFDSSCERLRYMALRDGKGSKADVEWRMHAEHCSECKASMHILELLATRDGDVKLGQADAQRLLEHAKKRFGARRHSSVLGTAGSVAWKVVVILVVMCFFGAGVSMEKMLDNGMSGIASAIMRLHGNNGSTVTVTVKPERFVPASAGANECLEYTLLDTAHQDAVFMPEVMSGDALDQSIRSMKRKLDEQADDLQALICNDYNSY